MRVILIILLVFLAFPSIGYTTIQISEQIVYEGEGRYLVSFPLGQYFTEENPKPEWMEPTSTACWRGYVATWKLDNDKLLLVDVINERRIDVDGKHEDVEESVFSRLFPESQSPLLASWFSGVLEIPIGKAIRSVYDGPTMPFKEILYVSIDSGFVIGKQLYIRDLDSSISEADFSWGELCRIPEGEGDTEKETIYGEDLEKANWIGGSEIFFKLRNLARSNQAFKIRGIIFGGARLWTPPYCMVSSYEFDLEISEEIHIPESGTPVEITATADPESYVLSVTDIRELPVGAPIQKNRVTIQDLIKGRSGSH